MYPLLIGEWNKYGLMALRMCSRAEVVLTTNYMLLELRYVSQLLVELVTFEWKYGASVL